MQDSDQRVRGKRKMWNRVRRKLRSSNLQSDVSAAHKYRLRSQLSLSSTPIAVMMSLRILRLRMTSRLRPCPEPRLKLRQQ
jgi:hypothetical protein